MSMLNAVIEGQDLCSFVRFEDLLKLDLYVLKFLLNTEEIKCTQFLISMSCC